MCLISAGAARAIEYSFHQKTGYCDRYAYQTQIEISRNDQLSNMLKKE